MMGANRDRIPPHVLAAIEQAEARAEVSQQGEFSQPGKHGKRENRKPNKYRAVRTEYGGAVYDSKTEALRAEHLDALARCNQIIGFQRQVTFRLGDGLDPYRVDFLVFDKYGQVHAEDVKGMDTPKFKSHVRRWQKYGPCDLWIIRKDGKQIIEGCKQET
jgi:hypothetical protein